jgi:hypothetical protein
MDDQTLGSREEAQKLIPARRQRHRQVETEGASELLGPGQLVWFVHIQQKDSKVRHILLKL